MNVTRLRRVLMWDRQAGALISGYAEHQGAVELGDYANSVL